MKNNIIFLSIILAATAALYSCSEPVERDPEPEPQMTIPKKPGAITKDPVDLTCNIDTEFTLSVGKVRWADSYNWTVDTELLEVIQGQGTNSITVRVPGKACTIPAQVVSVTATNSLGTSKARVFYGEILVIKPRVPEPMPSIEGYATKTYGGKTWIVENLRWGGVSDDLGVQLVIDDAKKVKDFGRFYTWYEAMTGLPACNVMECPYKNNYEGTDDAGNAFKMDGTTAEYNIQVQGVCPKGWHIANLYDWYDLVVAVKSEYNVPDDKLVGGYTMVHERTECYDDTKKTARSYNNGPGDANCGGVGAWLRGGGRIQDGGYWNNTNLTYKAGGVTYPLFVDGAAQVGFSYYPTGRIVSGEHKDEGKYGFYWLPTSYQTDDNKALPYSIGATNTNLSSYQRDKSERFVVRCVKNY